MVAVSGANSVGVLQDITNEVLGRLRARPGTPGARGGAGFRRVGGVSGVGHDYE